MDITIVLPISVGLTAMQSKESQKAHFIFPPVPREKGQSGKVYQQAGS